MPRRPDRRPAATMPLWAIVVIGALGNLYASLSGMDTLVRLGFGVPTVICIALLVLLRLRNRR